MPLFCFGRVEADTVIGSKPKITFVIFDDGIYLIVDERLLVANRMFDPFITGILIVAYCDADRVIGYPDAFIIYIEVVNTVAVLFIKGYYLWAVITMIVAALTDVFDG